MTKATFTNGTTNETVERKLTADELAAITETPDEKLARSQAECTANRHGAYVAEADPLFFKWQRGEGTEQAWRDKVDEIRQRYPDPT